MPDMNGTAGFFVALVGLPVVVTLYVAVCFAAADGIERLKAFWERRKGAGNG